jgi:hypothetical protein
LPIPDAGEKSRLIRLDLPKVNWAEIERLLIDSYLLLTRKRLAGRLDLTDPILDRSRAT